MKRKREHFISASTGMQMIRRNVSNGPTCWKTHERVDGTTKGADGSCQHKNPDKRPK